MIEYFFLLCTLVTLLCRLAKRYLTFLKMTEKLIDLMPSDYDTPQSDSERQKLLE